jgi:hypothetical protein
MSDKKQVSSMTAVAWSRSYLFAKFENVVRHLNEPWTPLECEWKTPPHDDQEKFIEASKPLCNQKTREGCFLLKPINMPTAGSRQGVFVKNLHDDGNLWFRIGDQRWLLVMFSSSFLMAEQSKVAEHLKDLSKPLHCDWTIPNNPEEGKAYREACKTFRNQEACRGCFFLRPINMPTAGSRQSVYWKDLQQDHALWAQFAQVDRKRAAAAALGESPDAPGARKSDQCKAAQASD